MTETSKTRLDQLLVTRNISDSRSKAQAMIKAGKVSSNGKFLTKPSLSVDETIPLDITEAEHPWVSRGGMKLAHAVEHFSLAQHIADATTLDIGASTGGFTDVLLHHGAKQIYAVDVGTGQLSSSLLADSRIISLENTNAKNLNPELIPDTPSIIVCDASFISLKKLLSAPLALAAPNAHIITLIKPQFEVGKELADKHKAVIKSEKMHASICDDIQQWITEQGWQVHGIIESPITGPKGNKEFLLYATNG